MNKCHAFNNSRFRCVRTIEPGHIFCKRHWRYVPWACANAIAHLFALAHARGD